MIESSCPVRAFKSLGSMHFQFKHSLDGTVCKTATHSMNNDTQTQQQNNTTTTNNNNNNNNNNNKDCVF
jgi:hypothetical protein